VRCRGGGIRGGQRTRKAPRCSLPTSAGWKKDPSTHTTPRVR
jgi:hypothetical protein